ncbi:MAG: type IX secretion system membrane protein PorP/SprF [Bacteroidota bacterium]
MLQRLLLLPLLVLIFASSAQAQDPQFSQFYANKLLLSPAFAGSAGGPRAALNYRNQWPRIPGSFVTYAASYDMPFFFGMNSRDPRHGLGINVMADQAGAGVLRKIDANLNYSFLIPLGRQDEHAIRLGVSGGIQQSSVDFFRLQFPDQFEDGGFDPVSDEALEGLNGNRIHEEVGAGILYFNKLFYAGGNVRHITRPEQKYLQTGTTEDTRLPMHIAAYTGLNIPFNSDRPDGPSISPAFMFRYQNPFTQVDVGLYANLDPIVIGTWYRVIDNDAAIFLVGLQQDNFSVGYSYDLTLSDLQQANTGGAHEVSLVFTFDGPRAKPRKASAKMSCPRF